MIDCTRRRARESGIASVAFTGLLVLILLLGVAGLQRHVLAEQRGATADSRAGQAFAAAEAGLTWAIARLNDPRPIGDDCEPVAEVSSGSFRARFLRVDEATARLMPTTRVEAGETVNLDASCRLDGDRWRCRCAAPASLPPAGDAAPGFVVRLHANAAPGVVRVESRGCAPVEAACDTPDAAARVQVLLGWLPALRTAPVAALTLRGDLVTDADLRVDNPTPASAGLTVHAGGAVHAPNARWHPGAGAPLSAAVASDDPVLAATPPARGFVGHFGLDPDTWSTQPAVRTVACRGNCAAALEQATAGTAGPSLLQVSGDALIAGPARLGSIDRPVALVVTGALRLEGPVAIVGVVHAGAVHWADGAATAHGVHASAPPPQPGLRGALLSASGYTGEASPTLTHDADVLARLRLHAGTFARVAGSWKDF